MYSNRLIKICLSQLAKTVKKVPLFFFSLSSMGCHAESFDDRLSSAKDYLASRQGETLAKWTQKEIAPRITPALQNCFSSIKNADTTGFMLVADVDSFGKMLNIAVKPSTNIANCVARSFESESFKKPPLKEHEKSFPVVFDVGARVP